MNHLPTHQASSAPTVRPLGGSKLEAVQRLVRPAGDPVGDPDGAAEKVGINLGGKVPDPAVESDEPCWDRTSDPLLKSAFQADAHTIRHHRSSRNTRLSSPPPSGRTATDGEHIRTGF